MSRILFIITQSEIGGAQRYLLELAPYLAEKNHEIVVVAGEGDDELFVKIRNPTTTAKLDTGRSKFKLYKIPNLTRAFNPLKDIFALIKVFRIIKSEKPDILLLQSTKAGFLGSLAAKLYNIQHTTYNIQVIYRIGGWSFRDPRSWWMNKILFWMEKISAPWKDVIIVNSELDRQIAIVKKIAPAENVVRIYNGIDPNKLSFLPKENAKNFILSKTSPPLAPHEKILLVGTVANLYATKGIEYLIKSVHILYNIQHTKYNIHFFVIGEGRARPKLTALIKKYNLEDKFFLVGRMPNATQYLKAFDVFVLPSVKEGFPWVLLEAMAAEVPIVATQVGAVPEIIEDGKEGLLIPPKDSTSLAQKIYALLPSAISYSHDREFIGQSKNLTKNATEKLKQFSLQKMLRQSEEVILRIMNHGS